VRKLGTKQRDVLDSLKQHGSWYAGCGWLWDTTSGTRRVMESLVKRGLVAKTSGPGRITYRPTRCPVTLSDEAALNTIAEVFRRYPPEHWTSSEAIDDIYEAIKQTGRALPRLED